MEIKTLIHASSIPPAIIAKQIGMQRGTFNNKLKNNNGAGFSYREREAIQTLLTTIANNTLRYAKTESA